MHLKIQMKCFSCFYIFILFFLSWHFLETLVSTQWTNAGIEEKHFPNPYLHLTCFCLFSTSVQLHKNRKLLTTQNQTNSQARYHRQFSSFAHSFQSKLLEIQLKLQKINDKAGKKVNTNYTYLWCYPCMIMMFYFLIKEKP